MFTLKSFNQQKMEEETAATEDKNCIFIPLWEHLIPAARMYIERKDVLVWRLAKNVGPLSPLF